MELKDLGEFGFIERFSKMNPQKLSLGNLGIGDDCAIIKHGNEEFHISTDLLVEDVHFVRSEIGGYQLGKKSLTVNLSDLAASGAMPVACFLSIGIPKDTDLQFLDDFMRGFYEQSDKYFCPLMGGDTTSSPKSLVINVTVVGKTRVNNHRLRSMAVPGDVICVTGCLGDSAAGLDYILHPELERDEKALEMIRRHHNPVPRVSEGMFLNTRCEVHAMMDISDGIGSDLRHILKQSNVSAMVSLERLPVSPLMRELYGTQPSKMYKYATSGGEDYELLLTVDPKHLAKLIRKFVATFQYSLTPIGTIEEGDCQLEFLENNEPVNAFGGFDHFTA